jgi:hypothetical protein
VRLAWAGFALAIFPLTVALAGGAGCAGEHRCGLRRCDIRRPDCQRATGEAAACLRGVEPTATPVATLDRDAYIRSAVVAPVDPAEKERWTRINYGLALLRLGDARVTYAEAIEGTSAGVGAFYSPDDKAITILDYDGFDFDSVGAVSTLVHEYVHALQDEAGHLSAAHDPAGSSYDRSLAASALIEGEADLIQDLANLALFDRSPDEVPWARVFGKSLARTEQRALEDPLPIERGYRYFTYPFGSAFLHGAFTRGGSGALDGAWAAPPVSTRQVMAGFDAAAPEQGWLEDLGTDSEPVLPPALIRITADRLGAFALRIFLAGLELGPRPSRSFAMPTRQAAVAELQGDHLSIFYDPGSGHTVASWRLRFDRADTATALSDLLQLGGWDPVQITWWAGAHDRDLILMASDDPNLDRALGGNLDWRAPPSGEPGAGQPNPPARVHTCPLRPPLPLEL